MENEISELFDEKTKISNEVLQFKQKIEKIHHDNQQQVNLLKENIQSLEIQNATKNKLIKQYEEMQQNRTDKSKRSKPTPVSKKAETS